jgi:hypothetical protein
MTAKSAESLAKGVSYKDFESYVSYKAFDLLSEGGFKKLVVHSRENSEPWAVQVYTGMQTVTSRLKQVAMLVNTLSDYGKKRLHAVCSEVVSSTTPPCKQKLGWSVCLITGIRSDRCLDLTRPGKSEGLVVISAKFSHFVIMLWFVTKLEHVCKTVAKAWLAAQSNTYQKNATVHEICEAFAADTAQMKALYDAFQYAMLHVVNSIEQYRQMPEFGTTPDPMLAEPVAKKQRV